MIFLFYISSSQSVAPEPAASILLVKLLEIFTNSGALPQTYHTYQGSPENQDQQGMYFLKEFAHAIVETGKSRISSAEAGEKLRQELMLQS